MGNASENGVNLAMEASVAGGIPIHTILREGIAGDRVSELYGVLNGTSNFILTEIEKSNAKFESVLAEAQQLGYAEADPSADVDGLDARSKLAILAALAFGERLTPADIYTEGIRRILPVDFEYAHQLKHTIRLLCLARQSEDGLVLSVRPSLIPQSAILAQVQGAYNAVWIRGVYGEDTFYYGRGAGAKPTGVAVVSDLMRVAREIRYGSPERVSPFAHERLGEYKPLPIPTQALPYFLRFRVEDKAGIIATLARFLLNTRSGSTRYCSCRAKTGAICRLSSRRNPRKNKRFATRSWKFGRRTFWWRRRSLCLWNEDFSRKHATIREKLPRLGEVAEWSKAAVC